MCEQNGHCSDINAIFVYSAFQSIALVMSAIFHTDLVNLSPTYQIGIENLFKSQNEPYLAAKGRRLGVI